jgi:hypothetical protein
MVKLSVEDAERLGSVLLSWTQTLLPGRHHDCENPCGVPGCWGRRANLAPLVARG